VKKVLSILFLSILFLGARAFADTRFGLPEPGLTPESPLYFLDLWDEQIRLFFTRSDSARFERYSQRALERMAEAESLAGEGVAASQRALELYQEHIPFLYATAERLDDKTLLADALRMATDHLAVLDHISERTDFERKRFVLNAKLFVINQQLQTLEFMAKRNPDEALRIYGDALSRRMERIRAVAIDDQNNEEAIDEYAAYMTEVDRILRNWNTVIDGASAGGYLKTVVRGHEETLLGAVRERLSAVLDDELLRAVNSVRQLSGKEPLLELPRMDNLPALETEDTEADNKVKETSKNVCLPNAIIREGKREYISKDVEYCARSFIVCNEDCQPFGDESGCGCEPVTQQIDPVVPVAPIKPQICSQEAKICPDGSTVGRIEPNCEFAACPTEPAEEEQQPEEETTTTLPPPPPPPGPAGI
jgi:hypothetical protein